MAATISGSGTSTLINLTTSGNTVLGDASTDTLNVGNGGLVKDASGNVGIGTSSPSFISGYGGLQINGGGNGSVVHLTNSTTGTTSTDGFDLILSQGSSDAYVWQRENAPLIFGTNATERMRIDSSGNLLVGTTTVGATPFTIRNTATSAGKQWGVGPYSTNSFLIYNQSSVGVYLTDGGTSWTSSSDERVKDIIEPITDAANKVSTLRAVIGKYKTDEEGTRRSFLIAQDVQAVLPEAVNVQEDEIGTLGVQYTDVIPLLVAAIQELKALVDTQASTITQLQADVAALKGTA